MCRYEYIYLIFISKSCIHDTSSIFLKLHLNEYFNNFKSYTPKNNAKMAKNLIIYNFSKIPVVKNILI